MHLFNKNIARWTLSTSLKPKIFYTLCLTILAFLLSFKALANSELKSFLQSTYEQVPKPQRLWIDKQKQSEIKRLFNPGQIKLSYRYWQNQNKTLWVLDEIGKERNITTGIVIVNNSIQKVEVLIYRESRGGQVQNPRFTQQYYQKNDHQT